MFEPVYHLLSYFGVAQLFSAASTTDVVMVFLASKPVFLVAAAGAAAHAYYKRDRRPALPDADADPRRIDG